MADKSGAHIFINGQVQGVGFRNFAQRYAFLLSLKGFVKNLSDGRVEIEIEGERARIDLFLEHLHRGPSLSKVIDLEVSWTTASDRFRDFSIL
ncbi:MAG: acylphosphatase [Nitrospirae bacterium]|nr:acylphosphatase [Candidatus Troglogloeales bacterium]MBI3598183.1 acylphosphatase [Candidatus Troglogloeales bacterium]